ncbi:response regulator transcription factor [Paenibacillus donghaensis]|uniref:DNA-binding response regulator n=1 Tax=Paenibacillus donghaensis TaxID=414771 RepID=A0A2Z2KGL3_9BACL|nr:response regulator transcription factor [Paenibacillus donghaensis]ASA25896.1 DNA-binding response regulator [Paenibacillus donghaensis]
MKIRVLIADDNSFIREGMKIILGTFEEFEVLATVGDGQEAVDFCRTHEVDVALLDVRMPHMNGVQATRLLNAETLAKPLILTTFDDDEYIIEAIRHGAKGYLLKNNDPERIREAIKSVHNGNNVIQDVVLDKLIESMGGRQQSEAAETSSPLKEETMEFPFDRTLFTRRELDVMSLIAEGHSNKGISGKLFISEGTTANYITSILNKTALQHRTQIAIYYLTGHTHTYEI